jgi:23S rRNA pseudouridine955/2504/2580 synthase
MKLKPFKTYVIHEDDNLIAINKPAGLNSLHDRFGRETSVQQLAEAYCETAQLCHRLDKETSGILLIAKDKDTYREVAMAFEKRKVNKTYWAILQGRHYFNDLEVDLKLSTTARGKAKVDKRDGKDALTTFSVKEQFRNFSLVECFPHTGRLHQIRIHIAAQNAPIAGDEAYGGELPYLKQIKRNYKIGKDREERPMIHRTALHARSLEFSIRDKAYILAADLPKDFDVFLKLLRKYDAEN